MTSLYENQLLWDWTTYHIDLARLALFVYRAYYMYMTLFNTTTLRAGLWRRGMTLALRAVRPGFETHNTLSGIGYFLLLQCFVILLSLSTMANISFFFHVDIFISTSSLNLAILCFVAKTAMHVIIGDICVSCFKER